MGRPTNIVNVANVARGPKPFSGKDPPLLENGYGKPSILLNISRPDILGSPTIVPSPEIAGTSSPGIVGASSPGTAGDHRLGSLLHPEIAETISSEVAGASPPERDCLRSPELIAWNRGSIIAWGHRRIITWGCRTIVGSSCGVAGSSPAGAARVSWPRVGGLTSFASLGGTPEMCGHNQPQVVTLIASGKLYDYDHDGDDLP